MERIVTKKKDGKDYLIVFGAIMIPIVVFTITGFVPQLAQFSMFLMVGSFYLAYRLITSRNIEFEYIVTNGDLDIDMIISQRKRKRIFSSGSKSFEVLAKVSSAYYTQQVASTKKKLMYARSMQSDNLFFIQIRYKNENTVLYFEPSEKMLKSFKKYRPRNVWY